MRSWCAMLALAACGSPGEVDAIGASPASAPEAWAEPGAPLPPPGVPLALAVTALTAGERTFITVSDANPNESVTVFRNNGSTGAGPCPAALGGVCMDLNAPTKIGVAVADAAGVAEMPFDIPITAPVGATIGFEAVAKRGVGGANSVTSPAVIGTILEPAYVATAKTLDGDSFDWVRDDESFETTSGVGTNYVGWDDKDLFLGVEHPDIGASPLHWVVVYIGTGAPGSTTGVQHGTQVPTLPFEANYLVRWKADDSYDSLETWDGAGWVSTPYWIGTAGGMGYSTVTDMLELSILRTFLGSDQLDVSIHWVYEGAGFESTYAGSPWDAFVDGYNPTIVTHLSFDLTSPLSPVTQNQP